MTFLDICDFLRNENFRMKLILNVKDFFTCKLDFHRFGCKQTNSFKVCRYLHLRKTVFQKQANDHAEPPGLG